jgi:hypothetical protein
MTSMSPLALTDAAEVARLEEIARPIRVEVVRTVITRGPDTSAGRCRS